MKLFETILVKIIGIVYVDAGYMAPKQPMCYVPPLRSESLLIRWIEGILDNAVSTLMFIICAPIAAIILSFISAKQIVKRAEISAMYALYRSFPRVLILSGFFMVILAVPHLVLGGAMDELWVTIGVQFWIINIFTGLGYALFSFKSYKIAIVALLYFLVLPAVILYSFFLICLIFPSLKKYIPKDPIEEKKERLRERLFADSKFL